MFEIYGAHHNSGGHARRTKSMQLQMFLLSDIYNTLNDNEEASRKRSLRCLCGKYICFFDRYVDRCLPNENLVSSVLTLKSS